MAKTVEFVLLESTKSISRKISVIQKSWNFHNVLSDGRVKVSEDGRLLLSVLRLRTSWPLGRGRKVPFKRPFFALWRPLLRYQPLDLKAKNLKKLWKFEKKKVVKSLLFYLIFRWFWSMMRSLQNFIIILTIATLASDGIASPVPENVKGNFEKKNWKKKNLFSKKKGKFIFLDNFITSEVTLKNCRGHFEYVVD